MRIMAFTALACCLLVSAAGCATSPSSASVTHGGRRAALIKDGLEFSAEVTSTTVTAAQGLSVRLTLRNTGAAAVRWDNLKLGWYASVTESGDLGGASVGIGGTYAEKRHPETLAPGETTTTLAVMSQVSPGLYRVRGAYLGSGPSGKTPEIVVRVRAR
jgi:hypothetical protein